MKVSKSDENAFTGLEAAIVLVAFIVVAAVFAYVMLGAGFATTEKSQATVHTAIGQATSGIQPAGQISIKADGTGNGVQQLSFFLQLAAAGTGTDMGTVAYTLTTPQKTQTYSSNDVEYTWVKEASGTGSNHGAHTGVLNPREMVLVTITTAGFDSNDLGLNTKFMVEVKPSNAAAVTLTGTVPGAMSGDNWYDVY
jgi:flagellin FlaB